jgi:hypothetical protein
MIAVMKSLNSSPRTSVFFHLSSHPQARTKRCLRLLVCGIERGAYMQDLKLRLKGPSLSGRSTAPWLFDPTYGDLTIQIAVINQVRTRNMGSHAAEIAGFFKENEPEFLKNSGWPISRRGE